MLPGGVSRDHVKDAWLLRHSGEFELIGIKAPPRGTRAELAYAWRGGLTRFPVRLYVLSASTTPYGRTTTVKVGCRFTLLANRVGTRPVTAEAAAGSWYQALDETQKESATASIPAQKLLEECAAGLGVTIAPGSYQLKGNILREKVSMSDGYVSVLADLLKSHCCVGYPTPGDQLMVKKIQLRGGGGPVFDKRYIIDLSPINGSEAGAETVTVRYDAVVASGTRGDAMTYTAPTEAIDAGVGLMPRWLGQIGSEYPGKGAEN
jgi:hypothetical protein